MNKAVLALLLIGVILVSSGIAAFALQVPEPEIQTGLMTFTSQQELEDFISYGLRRAESIRLPLLDFIGGTVTTTVTQSAREANLAVPTGVPDYSATNIQVAGVDEADIVKTDGKFIYLASKNRFLIVNATQAESMEVISSSSLKGRIMGLFINGERLAVFEQSTSIEPYSGREMSVAPQPRYTGFHIKVYDTSNKTNPVLVREVLVNGTYLNSRMIENWVYTVASQPTIYRNQGSQEIVLPTISVEGKVKEIPATEIQYSDSTDIPVNYSVFMAVNIQADEEPEFKVVLTGYATSMYVSQRNIYVTMPSGNWWSSGGTTVVHRISLDGPNMELEATGEVPGSVLNQFSMDEYKNHFRVATTARPSGSLSTNNVYILDASMKIVGSLEDLAPGERIHSARFMGARCYLVTFKKVDPLFTIDVSDPEAPRVLGKLKIPGYSDYLHPYDENHLIGIGKETVEAKEGDFAWYQGLKVSLFDVSDVEKPKEAGKLIIGDRGTDSPALGDHHALLFDRRTNLLVIPVLEAKIFPEKYPQGVSPSTQGEYVFQGAYVLNISPQDGISVNGTVTHIEDPQTLLKSGYRFDSAYQIQRSLYIGENLYTISDGRIKANSLADLAEISIVSLS